MLIVGGGLALSIYSILGLADRYSRLADDTRGHLARTIGRKEGQLKVGTERERRFAELTKRSVALRDRLSAAVSGGVVLTQTELDEIALECLRLEGDRLAIQAEEASERNDELRAESDELDAVLGNR